MLYIPSSVKQENLYLLYTLFIFNISSIWFYFHKIIYGYTLTGEPMCFKLCDEDVIFQKFIPISHHKKHPMLFFHTRNSHQSIF